MLQELLKYVLPKEIVEYFELTDVLTDVSTDINNDLEVLHLHLDEKDVPLPEYSHLALSANGFHDASTINDFPLRDRKVLLHVRRRRWVDELSKSYFRHWDLVAKGTCYSKESAS